ncbi:hypothetical protein LJC52_00970 [Bacteroidales bacterium OttesenSCG-928-A17]|nr:hypothetical protein [Bacteroidales bacterium OttesenSCG-928-A17]
MKRLAAHRIFISPEETYKLHYVEFDENQNFQGIFPLKEEIAQTAFYNGTLFLSNTAQWEEIENWTDHKLTPKNPVHVFHSESTDCTPAELGTSNSSGDSYIQRLC